MQVVSKMPPMLCLVKWLKKTYQFLQPDVLNYGKLIKLAISTIW
jgi:hypothetical protein